MKRIELDGKSFTIGRIVHYVESKEKQFPFILTACYAINGTYKADGVVLGINSSAAEFRGFVTYDRTKKDGTWHFPSMWRPKPKAKPQPGKPLVDPKKLAMAGKIA